MKRFTNDIVDIKRGNTDISKVYRGENLVWERSEFIYTGGSVANDLTTRKYDIGGDLIWSVNHGSFIRGMSVDSEGNVYTGGDRTSQTFADANDNGQRVTTRKYDNDGNLIWSVDHGTSVWGLAVDKLGNVYTNGNRTSNVTTRKYDNDGNLIWSVDNGTSSRGIEVDDLGNVYVVHFLTTSEPNLTTRKYDSGGDLIWSVNHGAITLNVAIDKEKNIYTSGFRTSQTFANANDNGQRVTTRKYDNDGNLIWSVDHGNSVWGIAVDKLGNVYTGGVRTSNVTTRKYDTNGNLIWSVDCGAEIREVRIGKRGHVYTTGSRGNDITTRKYDNDGNLIWSVDHGANTQSMDIFPPNKGAFLS